MTIGSGEISAYHECPGRCGVDNVPAHNFACSNCMSRLPSRIRRPLQAAVRGPELLVNIARAKLYWENTRSGD